MTQTGKVALITGSGRGLGRETALKLAQKGISVCINDINENNAKATAKEVEALGVKSHVSTHDISDHGAASDWIRETTETFGEIHYLVNNAGILRDAMLHKLTEENFDAVIKVNLKGVFNSTQAFAKALMAKGNSGAVVNISSIAWLGNVGQTNYSAAKAAVVGMTRTWSLELAKKNIRVNAVAPGLMKTEMTKGIPPEILEKLLSHVPMGRMGEPRELARLIVFLLSDDSSYITGQVINLDGGTSVGF